MKQKNHETLRYLSQVAGRTKLHIFFLVLLQSAHGLCGIYYALLLRNIIDAAVAREREDFFLWVWAFVGLVAMQIIIRAFVRYLTEYTSSTLENRMKGRLFSALLHRDYAAVTAVHSEEWMNRLTTDTAAVAGNMTELLPNLAGMLVKLVGAVAMIVALERRFLYILVPGGILMVVVTSSFRKVTKRLYKVIRERDGKLRILLQEMLSSLLVVRTFAKEETVEAEAKERMDSHHQARMRRNWFYNLSNIGFSAIMNGAVVLGAVFCGYGILMGNMSYGNFTAILNLTGQIQAPFANISGFLPKFYGMLASAERLMAAEKLPEPDRKEIWSASEVQKLYQESFEAIGIEKGGFTYQAPAREPEKYSEGSERQMPVVLRNLSLEIKKGQCVAFTGQSGCGKSTILKLLLCLYPLDEGEKYLQLDGKRVPLTGDYQRLFAYVPQGNHLMSGTIREIISFLDREKMQDEDRMWQALTIACGDTFVRELDSGLDTVLGERGLGLSEGQMQRLAIARAIFSECPILMLDECTSALDEDTEKRLLGNLQAMTDKTVLIVTHRPAALDICDRVLAFTESGCREVKG